jgi:hypothetical protein
MRHPEKFKFTGPIRPLKGKAKKKFEEEFLALGKKRTGKKARTKSKTTLSTKKKSNSR